MSDNKKLDQIIDQLNALEQKISAQDERLARLEGRDMWNEKPQPKRPETVHAIPQPEKRAPYKSPDHQELDFKSLELNIGKYLFQIIGAGIFIVGMGFLFQYSIEQGLISPLLRVIAGFVIATTFIVGGEFSRRRQWTLALIAGGVALYYVSLLAAAALYALVSTNTAFLASIAITILAVILGMLHDSIVIASFGVVGGLLAPVFVGVPNNFIAQFALFNPEHSFFVIAYLMLLAASFMVLSLVKRWTLVAAGSLFFILLYSFTPMIRELSLNEQMLYILAFYGIFTLLPYAYAYVTSRQECTLESWMVAGGGICSFIFCQTHLYRAVISKEIVESALPLRSIFLNATSQEITKYLLFIFGSLSLIKTMLLAAHNKEHKNLLGTLFLASVLSFFGVILLHFTGYTLGTMIQCYALLIVALGFFIKQFYVRLLGLLLFAIGVYTYLFNIAIGSSKTYESLIVNDLNIATAILFLIFAGAAYLTNRNQDRLTPEEKNLPKWLELGAYTTILIWMLSPLWQYPYYVAALALYALAAFAIGMVTLKKYLRTFSYASFGIATIGFLVRQPYFLPMPLFKFYGNTQSYYDFNVPCIAFIIALTLCIALTKKNANNLAIADSSNIIQRSELLLSLFAFLWAGRNLHLYTQHMSYHMTAMSVYYGAASLLLIFIGLVIEKKYIRYFGLGVSGLTLWTLWFIIMGMRGTLNRVIVFLVVGLIFMLASFIYQRLSKARS